MGRPVKFPPTIHTRKDGQCFVRVRGRDAYLGKAGSVQAQEAYARLVAALARGEGLPRKASGLTVADVAHAFMTEEGPRLSGGCNGELAGYRYSLMPLLRLYGATPAAEFGAALLEDVQLAAMTGSWLTEKDRGQGHTDWSAGLVNQRLWRVRNVWRWAERRGLVPAGAWANLRTVPPVRANDRRARHTPPRRAASWEEVRDIAAHARSPVREILLLLWHTGMRPAEAYTLTPAEVAVPAGTGPRVYSPGAHKKAHLGRHRDVVIGEEAWKILAPALEGKAPDEIVFPPVRWHRGAPAPTVYNARTFARAVRRAAARAGREGFTAYMTRHAMKARVTRAAGLDAARAVLGHAGVVTTAEYARAVDLETAALALQKLEGGRKK